MPLVTRNGKIHSLLLEKLKKGVKDLFPGKKKM